MDGWGKREDLKKIR